MPNLEEEKERLPIGSEVKISNIVGRAPFWMNGIKVIVKDVVPHPSAGKHCAYSGLVIVNFEQDDKIYSVLSHLCRPTKEKTE